MKQKSAQELLKECIDRGIECAMETPLEDCRVPFDIGTEIQFDIWDNIRDSFYFEYESVIKKHTHEEMLMDISDWVNDHSNTEVAPAVESNTPVAIVRDWGRIEWQEGVFPNLGAKLYMSPQESEKPAWIPLKTTERNRIIDEWHSLTDCVKATGDAQVTRLCKMIEEKLKELNT